MEGRREGEAETRLMRDKIKGWMDGWMDGVVLWLG